MSTLTTSVPGPSVRYAPAGRTPTPSGGWALADTRALIGRTLRRSLRTPDTLIMGIALPVIIMAMFVYVFGGAIDTGMQYVDYVVPGIVLLCAGYGASTTAVAVASDMTGGLMNRFRSLPMHPAAVLTGHVVESVVRNGVSTALVVGVAYGAGFRPTADLGGWLAVVVLVFGYVLALTWVAVCIGIVASTPEAASGFSFAIMFLPYVSSAFVQPETMPRVLELIARYQPVTPVTNTVRGWLIGTPGAQPWVAFAWCVGVLAVARVLAVVLFRRRARA
jgi:ABC-2 type transport system permease protein